jgi:hypothetical protein
MHLFRLFHFGIAVLLLGSVPALADGIVVKGEGRRVTKAEAQVIVQRYGSIPGDGMAKVKGEGRRVTKAEARVIVQRYGSIPGDGMAKVKGEGRRVTKAEARVIVQRYGSIPGDGMAKVKGEGRRVTKAEARVIVQRYGSIPGDGMAKVKGEGRRVTKGEARAIVQRYGSIPGGLILEGKAAGIDWARNVRYDAARGAFVLQDPFVYVSPVSAATVAMLARAIARDDRVGVSIGEEKEIVYGRLPAHSPAANDMMLTDNFLGDFILPPREWTLGYRLADNFEPRNDVGTAVAAVFFRFSDYELAVNGEKLELARANFQARVVPIVKGKRMADGGFVPDFKAIEQEGGFDAFEANAGHIGGNIGYYLQERIVARAMAYGEAAAFLRSLKANGVDLRRLALSIVGSHSAALPPETELENNWQAYLREIQADNAYANWTAPPYDLYLSRQAHAAAQTGAQEAATRP